MHETLAALYDFRLSGFGTWFVMAYAVVLGGSLGSFLNVVAYRLPLGMNLSRPGSRCPKCRRPIRPWHNLPVLGWLLLRGRCRDCGAKISQRYPMVELLVAVASGIVCWKSLVPEFDGETVSYSLNVIALLLRLCLIYLLFCSALLEFDGNRLPLQLNYGAALVLSAGALLLPELRPPQPFSEQALPPVSVLVVPLTAAIVLGLLSWPILLVPPAGTAASAVARICLLVFFAFVLGGLATMIAAPAAAALMLASITGRYFWPPLRRFGWACSLGLVTLVWFALAGPKLGANDEFFFHDLFAWIPDIRGILVPMGLLTAMLAVVGRLVHGVLAADTRSTH